MNRILKGLVPGMLLLVLLVGCSKDPEPISDGGLLDVVPADTPYVLVSRRRLPDPLGERLADHVARQLAAQREAFEQLRQQLREDDANGDLPSEVWQGMAVADALLAEFEGRDTAAKVRELGIEPTPLAVYYGLGILPAMRIEIIDADSVEGLLDRVERKSGLTTERGTIEGQAYRRIDLGGIDAVLAVTPQHLVAGLLPDKLFDRDLPLLLGVEPPAQSLAADGALTELTNRYAFEGYGEGFVRLDTLLTSLLGRSTGRNADVMQALGTESVPASTGCMELAEGLVAGMPRMVIGVSEVDERQLAVRGIWEATEGVSSYLRRLAAPVPGVGSSHDGLIAMGLGVELPRLRQTIEALLRHVVAEGAQCEWIDPAKITSTIPQLSLVLGPMTAGIKGFHLQIDQIDVNAENLQPESVQASLLAAVDDPRGIFALGAMFNPALGALDVPNDGTLVDLPRNLVADQPTPAMKVAIKDNALLLVSGDVTASESQALFSAPVVEPSPLFAVDYGVAQLVELLGGVMDQAAQRMEAQGENELAGQLLAQLDDLRAQAELLERMRVSIYASEDGLVMDQVMELR